MKRHLERMMPRIWTRLFLLTALAVVLTWIVIALAIQALNDAQRVVSDLDNIHVPALTQTSQLSAQIANLATLSNEILFATSISESPIQEATDNLSSFLTNRLGDQAVEAETQDVVAQLDAVTRNLGRMRRLESSIRSDVSRLRWLSLELEEETSALVADFTFNIQAQTRNLVTEEDSAIRQSKAHFLAEEMRRRDAFSALSSELTTLVSVALQIAGGTSKAQLDQLDDIHSDTLARVGSILSQVPRSSEFLTIRQSVDALESIAAGPQGLIRSRSNWIAMRDKTQSQLEQALAALSDVQQQLQLKAGSQRGALTKVIAEFTQQSAQKQRVLLISTVLALAGGMGILFLYVRPVIIRPMRHLTNAMNAIASGETFEIVADGDRHDEIGQLTKAVGTFSKSVEERDKAILALKATQGELVQAGKMAALGSLSAGIGHELNQPLGAMRQRIHLLRTAIETNDAAGQSRQTDKIENLADRMGQIIEHLKKFARRSEHLRETVELAPLIHSANDLMKTTFAERQIRLIVEPGIEHVTFLGDPVLVQQVIVNLLSNASDAIAETNHPGEISVEQMDAPAGMIAFSVVDTGVGLGDLDPDKVVDPFVTSKDPGAGLGLGLSISYNIIKGLGGNLTIAQRREAGVRATVTLPASTSML